MAKHEIWELQSMQASPLNVKVMLTKQRIRDWVHEYGQDGVYVSFSGGKDSTVLLHLVREIYPDIPAVYCNTGLEYPEITQFVKTFDNLTIIKPKMNFFQVCEKYGFPLISKEVSECVSGARKYLTGEYSRVDQASIAKNSRGGVRQEVSETQRNWRIPFQFEWEKLNGIGRFGTQCSLAKLGGGTQPETLQTLPESEQCKIPLTQDYTKIIDNLRVQRMMGINSLQGKVTMETIPDMPDRSMFSCVRYQFFLDAPFEISNQCCNVMKKEPMHRYAKETGRKPMTAEMASESRLRTQVWLRNGCNMFDAKNPKSTPMAFWTEQDVLLYIYENNIPIASVYGDVIKENEIDGQLDFADLELFDLGRPTLKTTGCERTGCVLCGYGAHRCKNGEKGRYERLRETHPKYFNLLNVAKNSGYTMAEAIKWTNEDGNLNIK